MFPHSIKQDQASHKVKYSRTCHYFVTSADSTPKVSVSADADVYEHLSAAYAKAHRTLHKDLPTACPTGIPGGIINGAKLGPVNGT